jgi:NADPH-dependent glutamate synthase beta subunit-like oxidoreductase
MADSTCPVRQTIVYISEQIGSGVLSDPKGRRICEQILKLTEEIAEGAAGAEHLDAIETLIQECCSPQAPSVNRETGTAISSLLSNHREVFENHIESRNCPSHDCERLAPSPCQMACPAGIDVPTYLALIAQGKDAQAIDVIRRDNPLPWICGLVCTRPCEMMCVRARIDSPISIKFLKAYAAERAFSDRSYKNPLPKPPNGKKVCVIGAGPGGLSAAYYLGLMGYKVKVIESLPVAGGMLMVGIPRYRLPREVIDREVGMIAELGVEFCFNTRFGSDITLDELKTEGFEAFFIAIGAHKAWSIGIEGEKDYPNVLEAIRFLKDTALGDRRKPGRQVVVIGGGNVAIDAARTSLRLGADQVTIAYRRSRSQMPADVEEVEQAEEEGVVFSFLTIPTAVQGDHQTITGLECIKAQLIKKEGSGRLAPVPIQGKEFVIQADVIISAIGQYVEDEGLNDFDQVSWSRRGTIEVDHTCMATRMPGVFAAGDAVSGPATVIEAVAGGKRAAEAIDRYLNHIPQPTIPRTPVRHTIEPVVEMSAGTKMKLKRPDMKMLNVNRRRTTFQQVELGYDEDVVRQEAKRCLRCDICRRCGDCVSVCRDKMGIDALQLGYFDFDHPVDTDFRTTAESCITCGACAQNCKNSAMVMDETDDHRVLKLCGTIINRQPIQFCDECGARLPSQAYLQFVSSKTRSIKPAIEKRLLCNHCQRRLNAGPADETRPVKHKR